MQAARDALDEAVAALFHAPRERMDDATRTADRCSCGYPLDVPDAWRALREFPVLARFLVTSWHRHAETLAPLAPKPKPRRAATTGSTRALELRVSSISSLCMRLHEAGVLASEDDSEVVATLIQVMSPDVFRRVLQYRLLSVHVRFGLLQFALSGRSEGVDTWIEDVCGALQQELRELSTSATTASSTKKKSKKRGRESMSRAGGAVESTLCERCVTSRKTNRAHVKSRRHELVNELHKWIKTQQRADATLPETVNGLCVMLDAPDVVRMLEPLSASSRQHGRSAAGRVGSTIRASRSTCDSAVDAVCVDEGNATASMWRLVWRRQSAKLGAQGKVGLEELVWICATADQFTRQTPSLGAMASELPASMGFRVIVKVLQETQHNDFAVVQLLHGIRGVLFRSSLAAASTVLSRQLRTVLIYYLRQFLQDVEENLSMPDTVCSSKPGSRQARVKQDPQQYSSKSVTIRDLMACLQELHEVITSGDHLAEGRSRACDQRLLFELWHGIILQLSCQPSSAAVSSWSTFLAAVAQCCEELEHSLTQLTGDFEAFVSSIVTALIVSKGTRMSSQVSSNVIEIPVQQDNRDAIEALLSMILSSSRSNVLVEVIFRLIVAAARSEELNGCMTMFQDDSGVRRLLFPSLTACLAVARPESDESRLTAVMNGVYSRIKRQCLRLSHVRGFVYFLRSWDEYCERCTPSTSQEEASTSHRQGTKIALQLRLWQDLVRVYAVDTMARLRHESRGFLTFAMELLRSVDSTSCPPELEGPLFSVLSGVSLKLQEPREDNQSMGHTETTIQQFLAVFARCSCSSRCKDILDAIVRDAKLEDLVLSLRRWLGIITTTPDSLPSEACIDLAVIANRLVFYCSEIDEVKPIGVLLAPVDPILLSVLHAYSSLQPVTPTLAASAPSISIVRISLMARSYLETTSVPDLLSLTNAFTECALHATTQACRDGMLKLFQGFAKFMITEIVVRKLHEALLLVGDQTRTRVVENALEVLAVSENLKKPRSPAISFSCELVSTTTTEQWLPVFLLAGLSSESTASSIAMVQAEAFLACITRNLDREAQGETVQMLDLPNQGQQSIFSHAYALVGLLSTVEVALVKTDSAPHLLRQVQDIHERLRRKLNDVQQHKESSAAESSSCLLCTTHNSVPCKAGKGNDLLSHGYSSGIVRILSTSASGVSPSGGSEWHHAVYLPDETIPESMASVRFFMPFFSWLRAAFHMPRHQNRQSENVFVEMVLQFYLPVEFYDDTSALTATWIGVWIERSLSSGRCVELSTLQRKLLLQLLSCSSPWPRLVQCAHLLLSQPHLEVSIPRDTVMTHIVDSLDFTTLCFLHATDSESIGSMAADIASVLEQVMSTQRGGRVAQISECLRLLTPLFEVFVRSCLAASSASPSVKGQDAVKETEVVFGQLRALICEMLESVHDSGDADWCRAYWHNLVVRWKRVYSHLNRSDSSRLLDALHLYT